jgi:hypothetical protein
MQDNTTAVGQPLVFKKNLGFYRVANLTARKIPLFTVVFGGATTDVVAGFS